ncbi:ubiquitin-protein ligase E3C [Babesia gibsoni]|uniref:HECT-type E3 ubiquitin transferase n=1 Tax=Babesia gibsoni TaxID=33632 RepID=A0AAD8PEW5_BABGI|nr:ubiquitin-protein ligase E3C [Babesia gibsoni]
MFFDGSIKPKRVVSLSGASGIGRNAGFNRQRFEFRSVQMERERAGKRLLCFLRYVVELKRSIRPLRDDLPCLLDSAERFVDQLARPGGDVTPMDCSDEDTNMCGIQSAGSNALVKSMSTAVSGHHTNGGYTNTDNGGMHIPYSDEELRSNLVSSNAILMFMRAVTVLTRYDRDNDYSNYRKKCLQLLRRWLKESQYHDQLVEILSSRLLKAQFIHLCVQFLGIILPCKDDKLCNAHHGGVTPEGSPRDKFVNITNGSFKGGITAQQGFSSWLDSHRSASNNVPLSQRLGYSDRDTQRSVDSKYTSSLSLLKSRLDLNRSSLSDYECDEVLYVVTLLNILPPEQGSQIIKKHEIAEKWYPVMLARAFVNFSEHEEVFNALLSVNEKIRHNCDSREAGTKLFVNFWSYLNMKDESYNQTDILTVADATIIHEFIQGLCCIGCKAIQQEDFGPINVEPQDKNMEAKIQTISQQLERSLKSSVPMTMSLNNENWNKIRTYLKTQVETVVNASAFLPFISEFDVKGEFTGNGAEELTQRSQVNSPLAAGSVSNAECESIGYAYERIFNNMYHLLDYVNGRRSEYSRDMTASILSAMLMSLQFVKDKQRERFLKGLRGYDDLLGQILYYYRYDEYIVITITLLMVPLYSWDYYTVDLEPLVISSCKRKLEVPTLSHEDWSEPPEIDGHVANLLVSCGAPMVLAKLFHRHYIECCGSNYSQLVSNLCNIQSNNGTLSKLWEIFSLVLGYCLKIMYDPEIIGEQGSRALVDINDAVFLANALNHFYWNLVSQPKTSKDRYAFQQGEGFPRNTVCNCGIELEINPAFHTAKKSPFDHVYWGTLARKFNERFFRLPGSHNKPMLISEVERAVLTQLKHQHLDSPVMSVMEHIPNTISFDTRLKLFMHRVDTDRALYRNEFNEFFDVILNIIRRTHIVEDGMSTLGCLDGARLKQPFKVVFMDDTGAREEGVDGGGLFKEFVTSVCSVVFNPEYGIFEESPYDRSFVPSPNSSLVHDEHLLLFNFIGKVVGKALYEHILIEPILSRVLLNLILKNRNTLDDLKLFDPELYRNIVSMRQMSAEDIASLGLTFTTGIGSLDNSVQVEIVEGGSKIKVTKDNLESFIHHFADFKCNRLIEAQSSAFLQGLSAIIPLEWMRTFSPNELVYLISGSTEEIDVADMRANTLYSGGYSESSQVVIWFWEVMREFDNETRRVFLWFVTCCKRAPLLGFKQLQPMFCITRDAQVGNMPTVSTCTNLLKLPEYNSKEEVKSKLLDAMTMSKGFGIA